MSDKQIDSGRQKIVASPNLFEYEKYYHESNERLKFEMCLNYIAQKLTEGGISVMVGAGFSLNANEGKQQKKEACYQNWAALLINAYKELYPKCDEENIEKEILQKGETVVAQEYVKAKGGMREALDIYIENQFSRIDKNTDNLSLHQRLLELGWVDVMTTNWDDLLERNTAGNGYYPVQRAKDLRCRKDHRIVKLNGSIRTKEQVDKNEYSFDDCDSCLYIATQSDFDNYKTEHASFFNFMQTKILELPFCLMGFSGRDPNFLYWIKELKRTMTKGGNTEYPNPIFLFDVCPFDPKPSDSEYERALNQFYRNNNIIRLKVRDYYGLLNADHELPDSHGKNNNHKELTYFSLNEFIFEEIARLKNTKLLTDNSDQKYFRIIREIDFSNGKLSLSDMEKYNSIELFSYYNLVIPRFLISKVQKMADDIENWTEVHYIFLYRWLLSNYYSLTDLYSVETVEKIVLKFREKDLIKTDAFVFSELILKYYRETERQKEFDLFCENEGKSANLEEIVFYQKALNCIDRLSYTELKTLLMQWHPEKREKPNALFILRKMTLLNLFESLRYQNREQKEEIRALAEAAEKACDKETPQLKHFVAANINYYKKTLNGGLSNPGYRISETISPDEKIKNPADFLDAFRNHPPESLSFNESVRYAVTVPMMVDPNKEYFYAVRHINFCEYTGQPVFGLIRNKKVIEMIPGLAESSYHLVKLFAYSLSAFGYDPIEGFLRLVLSKIMRFLPEKTIKHIFNAFFDILKQKLKSGEIIYIYLFLLAEMSKYADSRTGEPFFDFLFDEIQSPSDDDHQIRHLISLGYRWGAKSPLTVYIQRLKNKEQFAFLLQWVMRRVREDAPKETREIFYSEFLYYYQELLRKEDMHSVIRQVFDLKEIRDLLEQDVKDRMQLCLYGYPYLKNDIQKKVKQAYPEMIFTQRDPYFVILLKSEAVREKVMDAVRKHEMTRFHSPSDYRISDYINALHTAELLSFGDKEEIARIYLKYYDFYKENPDLLGRDSDDRLIFFNSYYSSLNYITNEEERRKSPSIEKTCEVFREALRSELADFLRLEWLYTPNLQKFKISYIRSFRYFRALNITKEYLYIFNAGLTKVYVQDDREFEAVIEVIVNAFGDDEYWHGIFNNEYTLSLALAILRKFQLSVPYCYDILFVKAQLKQLAAILKEKYHQSSDAIEYWIQENPLSKGE